MSETKTPLIIIPPDTLPMILAADKNNILGDIAAKVAVFVPDVSTDGGRDEMRSLARQIASAKNALIKIGKGLTEGWRDQTKAVNGECNIIEKLMDELRDTVRQPLTDFENAKKARVAGYEAVLTRIAGELSPTEDVAVITDRLTWLNNLGDYQWQEFAARGQASVRAAITMLEQMRATAVERTEQAAELTRLRAKEKADAAAQMEQDRIDRDARIAAEAAERATKGAEERERQAQARIAQMEQDRIDAAALAERNRLAAIETERKRAAAEAALLQAEADARAADVAHRAAINRESRAAILKIVEAGFDAMMSESEKPIMTAQAIITAIAPGEVPHVKIEY